MMRRSALVCSTCRRRTTSLFFSTFIAYTLPVAMRRTRKTLPKEPLPSTRSSSKSSSPTLPDRSRLMKSADTGASAARAEAEEELAAVLLGCEPAPPTPPAPGSDRLTAEPPVEPLFVPHTCALMSRKAFSSEGRGCRHSSSCAGGRAHVRGRARRRRAGARTWRYTSNTRRRCSTVVVANEENHLLGGNLNSFSSEYRCFRICGRVGRSGYA
jgi:hypothetical protein